MLGDIAAGMTRAFSDHYTRERDLNRKREDDSLSYQQELIKSLLERPDARPEWLGQAMHDLVDLQTAKGAKRKTKGMEGTSRDLPISQFLHGIMQGSQSRQMPQMPVADGSADAEGQLLNQSLPAIMRGGYTPEAQMPEGDWTQPQEGVDHSGRNQVPAFSGQSVLSPPVMMPPPGMPTSNTSRGMVKAGQQMQADTMTNPAPAGPVGSVLPPFTPDEMADQEIARNERGRRAATKGKIDDIRTFVPDAADQEAAIGAAMGVPSTGYLGTAPKAYIVTLPDGTKKEIQGLPLKNGGLVDVSTGQLVTGPVTLKPTSASAGGIRIPISYREAMKVLGMPDQWEALTPEQGLQVAQFVQSQQFAEYMQRQGAAAQLAIDKSYQMPQVVQGTDPTTLQAVSSFRSPASQGATAPQLQPSVPQPPMPIWQTGTNANPLGSGHMSTINPNLGNPQQPQQQPSQAPMAAPQAVPAPPTPAAQRPTTPQSRRRGGGGMTGGAVLTAPGGGVIAAPGMELRNMAAGRPSVEKAFNELAAQITELNKNNTGAGTFGGFGDWASGKVESLKGNVNMSPQAALYNDLRQGLLSVFSRFVGAERGTLTDADVARARDMMPDIGFDKKFTADKLQQLKAFIDEKFVSLPSPVTRGGAGLTPPPAAVEERREVPGNPGVFAVLRNGRWVVE